MLNTIKNMTLKNKLDYIWEYYKFHIVGIVIIIYVIGSLLNHYILNPPPKTYSTVAILEKPLQMDSVKELTDILNKQLIQKDQNFTCEVMNYYQSDDIQFTTAMQTAFIANLQSKNIDIIITTKDAFKTFSEDDMFIPLNTYLTSDELSKYNFVYDDNTKKPMGLILENSTILEDAKFDYKNMILGIAINGERHENTSKTLHLLLE